MKKLTYGHLTMGEEISGTQLYVASQNNIGSSSALFSF